MRITFDTNTGTLSIGERIFWVKPDSDRIKGLRGAESETTLAGMVVDNLADVLSNLMVAQEIFNNNAYDDVWKMVDDVVADELYEILATKGDT